MTAAIVQTAARGLDSSSQAHTVSFASPATAGNLLVVVYSTFGSQPTTPSGWSGLFWQLGGGDSIGVYYKTAAGGEQSAFINLGTRSNDSAFTAYEVSGWVSVRTANPRHSADLSGAGPFTTSAITLETASPMLLASFHIRDTATPLAPASASSPFNNDASADNGFNRTCRAAHYQSAKGIGQTETATFTVPNSSYDRGCYALIEIEATASTDVTASGAPPSVTVDPALGTATGGTDVEADGTVPNVTVDPAQGTGEGEQSVQADADLPSITVDPLQGSVGDDTGAGDLPSITVDPVEGIAAGPDVAFASQAYVEAIGRVVPQVRVSQGYLEAIGAVVPPMSVSQAFLEVLANSVPCVTAWAQCWRIERRDGQAFTFTSLDQDFPWKGEVYQACNSLNPSASESSSTLGSVGNIELEGIIASDAITEADLYGGLYDDAFVEVWLVPWDEGTTEVPKRIAAGWTGQLSQGEGGFKMEVLGPGARLGQQALVQSFTPTCRRVFGSPQQQLAPGGCGVDIEALKITGTVLASFERGSFQADLSSESTGSQWANGRVRWTAGVNEGQVCEVKEVDFATGVVTLWALAAAVPEYGDAFDLLPGCDLIKTGGCTVYNNIINFGGFDDVPGQDSLLETPDAKY